MRKQHLMTIFSLFLLVPAPSNASSPRLCKPWVGAYKGTISASDSVTGDERKIDVIVTENSISFDEEGSSFDASAIDIKCSDRNLTGVAEIGPGGEGRISMSISKGRGQIFYFRLFNYIEHGQNNFAEFLSSDDMRISVHKVRSL